ncbi:copper amine oxidase N-terminal domain-containing protein [Peptoniphilus harei]|uniref:copper amine oxidase N-terminal domain-containing protein n=1 Tax=Peptoniphilus harei TaxID=54005 RepID=UPI00254D20FF|nr:copper amine oxidase N-terminal domain-containing protein [Peptoniphilus harei]MDK7376979.1 copper amine oxidase N-terminal domain-containing protein [Peptoniphilus harei]MDK7678553.1 copper amine oxidase N-terminal domain-containing protein [Peptoniphilus harei]
MKKKILTIFLVLIAAITLGACSANTTAYLDASQKVANWKGSKVTGQLEYNVEVKNPETQEIVKMKFPVSLTGEQVGKDKAHVLMNMDFTNLKKEIAKVSKSQEEIAGLNKDVPDKIKMDLYVKGNEVIMSKDIFALGSGSFKDIKEDYISIADEENGLSPKAAQYFNSEEFKTDLIKLMDLATKDIKQEIDFKVEGNTYTLNANSDAIIDQFIKSADGVMKNWDAVSTSALAIVDKAGLPMTEEERKDFKELNKEYKAEDLKEAAKGVKEMIKGSNISQKTTFEENKVIQDLAMQFNFAEFVKVSVKGKVNTVKDENVKINFPTSVKKLTTEEYMKLIMPNVTLVTVRVNGEDITFEDPEALPKIMNDRTMLAARAFYEKIGAKVDWNGKDRTVIVTKDKDKIVLKIDSNKALVNGKEVALDSPAVIVKNKTYIPVRFVSEAFGYKVKYDKNDGMPIVDIFNMTEKELEAKLAEIEKEDNYKMIASMKTDLKDEEVVKTLKELYEGEELEKLLAAKADLDKNPELLKKYQEENKKEMEAFLKEDKEEVKEEKADKKETKEVKEEKVAEKTEKSAEKAAKVLFSVVK